MLQSTRVPSKQPNYPTKVPTTRQPSVSHWTQKYTYVRPSWKPSTFKPFTRSTLPPKPVVFTYTTSKYSTRPSFKPFTTKRPQTPSSTLDHSFLVTNVMKLNFTAPAEKVTTPSYSPEKPVTANTAISLIKTSSHIPPFTTSHSVSIPVTPNYTPFYSTVSKTTQATVTTQNWFYPLKTKSSTTSFTPSEANFPISIVTAQKPYTMPSSKISTSTPSGTTLKENDSSTVTFKPATSVTTKTTTPLPGKNLI